MRRLIEHAAFAHRSYGDVCHIFFHHGGAVLGKATNAASLRSVRLVEAGDQTIPGFDSAEALDLKLGPITQDKNHASMEFSWDANETKRLLANVYGRLDLRPLVKMGPSAMTEIVLRAEYTPSAVSRRSPEAVLFGRRVVKAALHRFLDDVVSGLDDYEESLLG
ncbi:MAG: hypothetical protein ACI9C1_003118 [Candidatus Aldehydirespiratoraceae bacterium]|jgi:hypothetical protein